MKDQATEQGLTADAPQGWQPIDTFDGRAGNVLICRSETYAERITVAEYLYGPTFRSERPQMDCPPSEGKHWYLAHTGGSSQDGDVGFNPTHWMPLPSPPLYEQEQQG